MKPAITSAVLVASVCAGTLSLAADMEIGKVFQSRTPYGQPYLVVKCIQMDECFDDAYVYCKGPYQPLDDDPSPVGFRFECKYKRASDPIEPAPGTNPKLTQIRPGKGFPITEDYYPIEARNRGEQGRPIVKVCLSSDGKLTQPPTIEMTSGSPRLDAAAIKFATAGEGHYVPATSDGKPVAACSKFGVRFAR